MARVLILCPTHNHADTLLFSIASVRAQSFEDWRMVVIGDGAPDRTRAIVNAISAQDARISYVEHPKGAGLGEAYRDPVLRDAREEFVCHLSDDDIWASTHLASMVDMLGQADFAYQAPLVLRSDGLAIWRPSNPGIQRAREKIALRGGLVEGLNNVGYRRAAYLDLAEGWTPNPEEGQPSDWHMWRKFLIDTKITVAASAQSHVLKLASKLGPRAGRSAVQRCSELGPWLARVNTTHHPETLRLAGNLLPSATMKLSVLAAEEAPDFEAALQMAGLWLVDQDQPANTALNGDTMTVPSSPDQQRQIRLAYLTRCVMIQKSEAAETAWRDCLAGNAQLALLALNGYAVVENIDQAETDALFEACFPIVSRARKLRNSFKAVTPRRTDENSSS